MFLFLRKPDDTGLDLTDRRAACGLPNNMKICPTCKGTGYFVDCDVREDTASKETARSSMMLQFANCLDTMNRRNPNVEKDSIRANPSVGDTRVDKTCKSYFDLRDGFGKTDKDSRSEENFRERSEILENFQESMRLIVQKLKMNNWESSVSALLDVVDLSRIHPEIVDSSMPLVTRNLCSLMKNVRSQVVSTACQIAEELFKTMQCTQKPEFDELIFALLQKTSHMNRNVRHDANRALEAMTKYITPSHCISAMSMSNAAGHRNSIVRTTVSRLLYDIVYSIGLETFLMTSQLRDARRRTFVMCIEFLNDSCIETRSNARRLIQLLMQHDQFNVVFGQDVERSLMKKIEKQLIGLKYDCSNIS